ncbi:MAG: ABC transporter ATP-binding protein/permease [Geminicoccaceae bacterium]
MKLVAFALPFVWPKDSLALRSRVVIALVLLVIAKLVNVTIPFFLKDVIDELGAAGLTAIPLAALLGFGAARFGSILFRELRDAIFAKVGQRAGRRLALAVYEHLFDLSLAYHLDRRTGELARSIDRGVKGLSYLLRSVVFNMGPTLLEFMLVIGILLARYPWHYAFTTLLTIVAYAVFTVITTNWRTGIRREMNRRDNEFNAAAVDGLINYEVVKAFANEGFERDRLDGSLAAYEQAAVKSETSLAFLNTGQSLIIAAGLTLLMIQAAYGVVDGTLTVGDVVLLNTFMMQLYQPLNILGFVYREVRQAVTDLERIDDLLSLAPDVADRTDARPLAIAGGRVHMEGVTFRYDDRRNILDNVDLAIESGRTLAVVGPSGSGKSTLVRLLFRFYDLAHGSITIDDQNIADVSQASLRRHIGLVPQDTVLFNDTIGANIAYGRPGASQQEIVEAARKAQIHSFVESLPDGYATLVGERGLKLSGGEKQRVAIARVLLKDPEILVLDEATSALDSQTEQALQEALREAAKGRTTLVIAHRLSTIADADEIVVLERGRIAERGRHTDLLARGGLYADMWMRQQAGEEL